mmetsp:Transcript_18802/g.28176  ORF Transcript_18802/g.28176 Transcript_18802/m.28176 type:complete len:1667 (-) Transcript_18802:157-5157(-)
MRATLLFLFIFPLLCSSDLFDEWSKPRKSGSDPFSFLDDIRIEEKDTTPLPTPEPTRKRLPSKELLDSMGPLSKSRQFSKLRLNISIGTGEGQAKDCNIVHNDEVVIGKSGRGGIAPDPLDQSYEIFIKASVGSQGFLIERCSQGEALLNGGCAGTQGLSTMRPGKAAFLCKGQGKKKVFAICAQPEPQVDHSFEVIKEKIKAGERRGEVKCKQGFVLHGGGCDLGKDTKMLLRSSGPVAKDKWRCEANGPVEKEWDAVALCGLTERPMNLTMDKGASEATAMCPAGTKVTGGGCHVLRGDSVLTISAPILTQGWQCRTKDPTSTVAAVAICANVGDTKKRAAVQMKYKIDEETGSLVAPAEYNTMALYVSHANDPYGKIRMLKPLVTTPGDGEPLATAKVIFPDKSESVNSVVVPWIPYLSTVADIMDEDDAVQGTRFDVEFSCAGPGMQPMLLVMLFVASGQKGYERVTIGFHKNCTGVEADKSVSLDTPEDTEKEKGIDGIIFGGRKGEGGLRDLRIGTLLGGSDVFSDGKLNPRWNKGTKQPVIVGANVTAKNFYIALDPDAPNGASVSVNRPSALVANSSIVQPTVNEILSLSGFNKVDTRPSVLTVRFDCRASGKTSVAVIIPTSVGLLKFQFIKECDQDDDEAMDEIISAAKTPGSKPPPKKKKKPQGKPILGFVVGTDAGKDNVISNGFINDLYRVPRPDEKLDTELSNAPRAQIIPSTMRNFTFYIGLKHTFFVLKYSRPTVVADSEGPSPIAFPSLSGSYMQHTRLENLDIHSLTVTFNCVKMGIADIIFNLPLSKGLGSLQFALRKMCNTPRSGEHLPKPLTVNGLNMGTLEVNDIVDNGEVNKEFSWTQDYSNLHVVGTETPVFRIVITREIAPTNPEMLEFQDMTITAHRSSIIDPEVGRGTPPPFTLDSKVPIAKVTVLFNCKRSGHTLVTIALPWTMTQPKVDSTGYQTENRYMGTIQLHLLKMCNDPHKAVVRDEGGVDIEGFMIGYREFTSNVVRDGFPTRHYFGQRNKINPDWKAIMVPSYMRTTTFHITYAPKSLTGDSRLDFLMNQAADLSMVEFDPPMIHSHDAIASPDLLGRAANGARLIRGNTVSLTIQWNCRFNGTTSASIRIPIRPEGFITFTIPKVCDKPLTLEAHLRREMDLASGLFVSTYYDASKLQPGYEIAPDVIDDGITLPEFSTYHSGKRSGRFIVDSFDHSTLFFIWHDKQPAAPSRRARLGEIGLQSGVQVLEPMIFTHRPICNPTIQHNFKYSEAVSKPGFGFGEGMMMLVNEAVHALNVTYNCVWEGETAITVVIPLTNGGKLSYTWTKVCTEAEYDQYIPHCVQYKTPEQSETILGAMWEFVTSFTYAPDQETVHMECEECEPGYLVVKALDESDFEDVYDVDGEPMPQPVYKRDECVRNASHFGYEDESLDNWDTFHLDNHLNGNSPAIGEVDNNEGWHENDEINWKKDPIAAAGAATTEFAVMLNVGTTPGGNDVVDQSTATGKYALQGGEAAKVPSSVTKSTFYLSVPDGIMQKIGYAEVKTRLLEGEKACSASVSGDASRGGKILADQTVALDVEYECERPGATAVLVIVPIPPSSSVSFRIVKLCKGYQTRADRAWVAHKSVLVTAFMVLLLVFCCCGDFNRSARKNPHSITLVSLDPNEAKMD